MRTLKNAGIPTVVRRSVINGLLALLAVIPAAGGFEHVTAGAKAQALHVAGADSTLVGPLRGNPKPVRTPTPAPTQTAMPTATARATATVPIPPTATATAISTPSGSGVAATLAGLRLMNYYPAQSNWANMWLQWNPSTIDADFGRIAALHANAVRVILQAWTIGYPTPQSTMSDHLAQIISLAQAHGLRVQLSLFDWWSSYSDLAGSQQWARAILAPYAGDPRIAFVELHNEINPTDPQAMAWIQQMMPFVKTLAGGIPVTVSVSSQYGISGLQTLVNSLQATPPSFYDYHYYDSAGLSYSQLQRAQQVASPLPLFIGETGFSSSLTDTRVGGLPDTASAMEAYQDFYFRAVQTAAASLGLPVVSPWVLSDFTPGSLTWVSSTSPEYGFGLYRTDGSAKAVVASVASAFATGAVDTSFNNSFEDCANGVASDWLLFHSSQAQFACDTTVAHSGTASGRISNSSRDSTGVPALYLSPTNAHVVPGQIYTATVWSRGQASTGTNQIALAWFDASNNYLGTTASSPLPGGTTAWTQLTARGSAPAGAAYVQLHLKSAYNSGTVWFDDVTYQ